MAQKLTAQLTTKASQKRQMDLGEALSKDAKLRTKFVNDPSSVLKQFGVKTTKSVKLSRRDKQILRLFTDPKVNELYAAGEIDKLNRHIATKHKALVGSGTVAGAVAADFHVLIETEVVAVAIAIATAIVLAAPNPIDRLAGVEANTGVLDAKLAAVEARLRKLERTR